MGWIGPVVGNVQHEGWVVTFFADGAESAGSSGSRGILVDFDRDEWRPDSEVVGWRAGCDCGWRGGDWTRTDVGPPVNLSRRTITHTDEYAYLDDDAERAVIDEWRAHIAPWLGVELVEEAAERAHTASRALDEAVSTARAGGTSWADIGRAVGITRQSAHERWSR